MILEQLKHWVCTALECLLFSPVLYKMINWFLIKGEGKMTRGKDRKANLF